MMSKWNLKGVLYKINCIIFDNFLGLFINKELNVICWNKIIKICHANF